ncbi:MAG TPA: acyl-CoA dehydrogenase family protein [Acidimicrobiales bacterium]|nr:acyl-CoA dehydrogenase family protein [Acidimicrobiales bacterium]
MDDAGGDEGRRSVEAALDRLVDELPGLTDVTVYLERRFDLGLAWVWFPVGRGGSGASADLQPWVEERLRVAGAPDMPAQNRLGFALVGPTLMDFATSDQLDRHLRPTFTGEEVWCQLFSEPGAGSDLAGLATQARRDGDAWVVNGQKVWTTQGQHADRGMLLARTDPDVPKHAGITFFLLDMRAPGVLVKPLRQMTGDAEFCEVFFDDVMVPDSERLGEVGEGWRVTMTTLTHERMRTADLLIEPERAPIDRLLEVWREVGGDAVARDALVRLVIQDKVVGWTNERAAQDPREGPNGPATSIAKLAYTEMNQRIYDLAIDLLGPRGVLFDYADAEDGESIERRYLRSRANRIEGGSSEIMRNIIGERVLGLPPEPKADRGPWRDIPRSAERTR